MSTGQAIFNNKQSKRDLIIILFCYYLRDEKSNFQALGHHEKD